MLLATAQLAIGAAAIFARLALAAGGPLAISAARLAIAAVPLALLGATRGSFRVRDAGTERRLLVAGVILAVHFATWIASLRFASVAISTLLVCTTPIWTEAYAVARRRRLDPYASISIVAAVGGVAMVVGVPDRIDTPLGIALALIGGVAMAAYLILVGGVDRRYDTVAVIARTYGYAALVLTAVAFVAHDPLPPFGAPRAWAGVVAMALLSQLYGHTALNAAVRALTPTFVATTILLEPIIAAALAAWIFAERLAPGSAFGAIVILAAIAVAVRGEARAASAGSDGGPAHRHPEHARP